MEPYLASRPVAAATSSENRSFQPLFSVFGAPEPVAAAPVPMPTLVKSPMEPNVEIVESEGRITRIVVTCRCCEKIELDCQY